MKCIYKGDDAPDLVTIKFRNDTGLTINALITTCGKITHRYENPTFTQDGDYLIFKEGYTAEETLQFDVSNTVYAGVEIESIGNVTFNGSLSFRACPKVVNWEADNE